MTGSHKKIKKHTCEQIDSDQPFAKTQADLSLVPDHCSEDI